VARLVIVSNRVSLPTERGAQTGGLAAAMRAALSRRSGVWFGWSGRTCAADAPSATTPQVICRGAVQYAVVDLTETEYERFYLRHSNAALWPVLHSRLGLMEYSREAFAGYLQVNRKYADLLTPFVEPDDCLWVHDYQLIPLGAELRARGVLNRIGFFLHTPLPPPGILVALPGHEALAQALMAYDVIGFQTEDDLNNFRSYMAEQADARLDEDGSITAFGRETVAGAFPISIDPEPWGRNAVAGSKLKECRRLAESIGDRNLIIGIDRLDYSKGLPERFQAFRALLERWEKHRGKVTFLQIAVPSRSEVSQYRTLRRQIESLTGSINAKFADLDWVPLRYVNRSYPQKTLAAFYRLAKIGLVTPLRDGMNLVAKEFVASQDPEDPGVLVLSRFAGAAHEMEAALVVNPFDWDGVAEALDQALSMSREERQDRWTHLISQVRQNTISRWRDSFTKVLMAKNPKAALAALGKTPRRRGGGLPDAPADPAPGFSVAPDAESSSAGPTAAA